MADYKQQPPFPGAVPPPPPPPPGHLSQGYPPPPTPLPPPQATPMPSQPSKSRPGFLEGCLGALACCCCLEMCCT